MAGQVLTGTIFQVTMDASARPSLLASVSGRTDLFLVCFSWGYSQKMDHCLVGTPL